MNTYFDKKIGKLNPAENRTNTFSAGKSILLILMITLIAGLIIQRASVAQAVSSAIRICLSNLIPALFPFMVISEIFIRCFSSNKFPLLSAFLIGNICGFPIGAKILSDLYSENKITSEQYRNYLPLCSNPGLAFTVVGVGANLWNSYLIGITLYIATVISGVATFLIFSCKKSDLIAPQTQLFHQNTSKMGSDDSFVNVFVSAVTGSTLKMLNVCGFVIFFSAFTSVLCGIFNSLEFPSLFSALIYSIFEISGATAALSQLPGNSLSPTFCLAMTFFSHGFGGLCIYAQIISVSADSKSFTSRYLLFKMLQGVLSAVTVTLSPLLHIILTGGINR